MLGIPVSPLNASGKVSVNAIGADTVERARESRQKTGAEIARRLQRLAKLDAVLSFEVTA